MLSTDQNHRIETRAIADTLACARSCSKYYNCMYPFTINSMRKGKLLTPCFSSYSSFIFFKLDHSLLPGPSFWFVWVFDFVCLRFSSQLDCLFIFWMNTTKMPIGNNGRR